MNRGQSCRVRLPSQERAHGSAENPRRGHGLFANVNHAGRANQLAGWDVVQRVVDQILAGNPVDESVEVRAGMFAKLHDVPIPGRAAVVVTGNGLHTEGRRVSKGLRQVDDQGIGAQGLGQVDDIDAVIA